MVRAMRSLVHVVRRSPFLLAVLVPSQALAAQTVRVDLTAAPGTVQVAPGVSVNAWLYNGTLPGPALRVREGQTLRVRFMNQLPESSEVHWHGQPVQLGMDGVPGISRPAVAPRQEFLYELPNLTPGTYWFHPHGHESQLDVGLAGVLIVDPANSQNDPPSDVDQVVVLDDWRNPLGGAFTGHLLNGRSSLGQAPIAVQSGQRLRLRFVNAAAVTNYVVALDGHPMTVTHADGNRVQPVQVQAIPIGSGERYDVIVDCTNPGVWSLAAAAIEDRGVTLVRGVLRYAGQTLPDPAPGYVPPNLRNGSLLGYAQLAAFFPVTPITPTPDRSYVLALGMRMLSGRMVHTINGETWPNVTPLLVAQGEQVQFAMTNVAMVMMSEYHPMHLHGHFFRLLGTAGGASRPPLKDTVLIRPNGQAGSSMTVQVAMENPGRWVYHCHNVEHLATGMMTAVDYVGDADADAVPDRRDHEPIAAQPVAMISDQEAAFVLGGTGDIRVQWTTGQRVALFAGLGELVPPIAMPPYGTLVLDPLGAVWFGNATADAQHIAAFGYTLPTDPALRGVRLGLQAVATTPLPGGARLSTFQAFTIR
jgi:FtsP/CotA-like multicopper oxidase with cupredoxin domain